MVLVLRLLSEAVVYMSIRLYEAQVGTSSFDSYAESSAGMVSNLFITTGKNLHAISDTDVAYEGLASGSIIRDQNACSGSSARYLERMVNFRGEALKHLQASTAQAGLLPYVPLEVIRTVLQDTDYCVDLSRRPFE